MPSDKLIGQQIDDYRLIDLLGKGGMGAVYLAEQQTANNVTRTVAVKLLLRELTENNDYVRRFEREISVAIRMEHPHILPVYTFGKSRDGQSYIVMRYLKGGSLSDKLKKMGFYMLPEAISLLRQVGGGLDYAHRQGVIHRDLKPPNIMFDEDDNAYLTDFGIAKPNQADSSLSLSQPGLVIGTPTYMAPEQWLGHRVDARADLYSLGIMAYYILTGEEPFQASSIEAIRHRHINDQPVPPNVLNSGLNHGISQVILKALSKHPDDRYQSAQAFVKDIELALAQPSYAPQMGKRGNTGTEILDPNALRQLEEDEKTTIPPTHITGKSTVSSSSRKLAWVLLPLFILTALGIGLFARFTSDEDAASEILQTEEFTPDLITEEATPILITPSPTASPSITPTSTNLPPTEVANLIPISEPPTTLSLKRDNFQVVVRDAPKANAERLGQLMPNTVYQIYGRNPDRNYWLINYNGAAGWVYETIATEVSGNPQALPIVTEENIASFFSNQSASLPTTAIINQTTSIYKTPRSMGLSNIIKNVTINTSVTILAQDGTWYQVRLSDGTEGWIDEYFIGETNQLEVIARGRVLRSTDIYAEASRNSEKIGRVLVNKEVDIVGQQNPWVHVQLPNNKVGWVHQTAISILTNPSSNPNLSVLNESFIELVYKDDFEGDMLTPSWQNFSTRGITVADGQLSLEGRDTEERGVSNSLSHNGVLFLFKHERGQYTLALESGSWDSSYFRSAGIQRNSGTWQIFTSHDVKGKNQQRYKNIHLNAGNWYYVKLWFDESSSHFYVQIWEKDNRSEFVVNEEIQLPQVENGWARTRRQASFRVYRGTLVLDYYEELDFKTRYTPSIRPNMR